MSNLIFRILLILAVATFSVRSSFDISQLPLSDKLLASFPTLNTSCFIVSNRNCSIIIHEKNSDKKINTGTFDDIFFSENALQAIGEEAYLSNAGARNSDFIKSANSFSGESKSTLYDMCCIWNDILKSPETTSQFIKNVSGIEICFFKSAMSGVGCAFRYKNKSQSDFVCVLYGLPSEDHALADAKNITKWLDQFFVFNASEAENLSIKIPVLYGSKREIVFDDFSDHFVILSKKYSRQVSKVFRYRTLMKAPINFGDELGFVFYLTDVFKNPIVKVIKSRDQIKKSKGLKCLVDSILYVIFGFTAHQIKSKDLD